jgi:hypothetical protein
MSGEMEVVMSKKRKRSADGCSRVWAIADRVNSSWMTCYTQKRRVYVEVNEEKGNRCTCTDCPHSPAYAEPAVELDARLTA